MKDSEDPVEGLGGGGWRTKDASCSELRDLQTRGTCWKYVLEVPGRVGSKLVIASFPTPLFTS